LIIQYDRLKKLITLFKARVTIAGLFSEVEARAYFGSEMFLNIGN
jgi:hypothetical protein